jgi:hypothetical protein
MNAFNIAVCAGLLACSGVAAAQVETNGVVNNITFNADGTASIASPAGQVTPANWTATGGRLCLVAGGQTECFPYAQAFQAGQPVSITSSCNATSRWLASSTNQPIQNRAGERG